MNLPSGLYVKVKKLVKTKVDFGYRSVTEFVAEAVRRRIEEIEKMPSYSSAVENTSAFSGNEEKT